MDKKEKRQYVRIYNEFDVKISNEKSEDLFEDVNINKIKSINISANGILIKTDEKFEINTKLKIKFLKPDTFEFFTTAAEVVRMSENDDNTYSVGIKFVDISKEDLDKLNYYITLKS